MRQILAALILVATAIIPARADQLAAGLSTDSIQITSSFRGADIVIFGAVAANGSLGDLRTRDVVVVLRGPAVPLTVRRKERIAGIWINATETRVTGFPTYYYWASARGFADPTSHENTQTSSAIAPDIAVTMDGDPSATERRAIEAAIIRAKTRARLFGHDQRGVELLGPHLFRARMHLPAAVPPGTYRADVFLFHDGVLVARANADLPIDKAGLERRLADYAENQPLPYALATVMMALALGWLGFAVFRAR